jgi:hypothetical protein
MDPEDMNVTRRVQVLPTALHIRDLGVARPALVEYFRAVAPDKQEVAVIHALEVGVAELLMRRRLAR